MITDAVVAFGTVLLAELPDKTMVASLVLTTRYRRPAAVWVGVTVAFGLHVIAAVLLGSVLNKLPQRPLSFGVGCLFLFGAWMLWRSDDEDDDHDSARVATTFVQIAIASGAVVLLAELGDLTQLATAGLASKSDYPVAVGLGAWAALASVAGLAVTAGAWIERRVPLGIVRKVAAVAFAIFGIVSIVSAIVS